MTTTEQALDAARRLARRAAQRQAGLDTCPYPADGTPVQRAARRAWVRTYLHWRRGEAPPVDFGDDLLALAHGPDSRTADNAGAGTGPGDVTQGTIITGGGQ